MVRLGDRSNYVEKVEIKAKHFSEGCHESSQFNANTLSVCLRTITQAVLLKLFLAEYFKTSGVVGLLSSFNRMSYLSTS